MFCNGMVVLPDGRVFINGGNLRYDPFLGEPRSSAYDPTTGRFTDLESMAHGRWYPTVTTLGDGRVMTFSGLSEFGMRNTAVEIYTVGSGWSQEYQSGWTPPLYPRMHLLPAGHDDLQSGHEGLVPGGHDQLQRHAHVWLVGAPAPDARGRIQTACDDLRRRRSCDRHHGDHRPVRRHPPMAVRAADVAAADRDERDDPAER